MARKAPRMRLTPTQKQVLLLRAAGLTQQQIADRLGCTYDTVGDHCKAIHKALKASCGIEALGKAVVLGIITLQELTFLYTSNHSI